MGNSVSPPQNAVSCRERCLRHRRLNTTIHDSPSKRLSPDIESRKTWTHAVFCATRIAVRAQHHILLALIINCCEALSRDSKTILRRRIHSPPRSCRSLLGCRGRVAATFLAMAPAAQTSNSHSRELPGPKAAFFKRANRRLHRRGDVCLTQFGPCRGVAHPGCGYRFLQVSAWSKLQLRPRSVITACPGRIRNRPSCRIFRSHSAL